MDLEVYLSFCALYSKGRIPPPLCWGLNLELQILGRITIAVVKHHEKQLEEKGVCLAYASTSPIIKGS